MHQCNVIEWLGEGGCTIRFHLEEGADLDTLAIIWMLALEVLPHLDH